MYSLPIMSSIGARCSRCTCRSSQQYTTVWSPLDNVRCEPLKEGNISTYIYNHHLFNEYLLFSCLVSPSSAQARPALMVLRSAWSLSSRSTETRSMSSGSTSGEPLLSIVYSLLVTSDNCVNCCPHQLRAFTEQNKCFMANGNRYNISI